MYIITGSTKHYAVASTALGIVEVRYTLEEIPAALGTTVKLYADDGACIREDAVADWEHPRIEGNTIILSNTAPVEPVESGEKTDQGPDILTQTQIAFAELAETESAHDLENKLALAELAEMIGGANG